MLHVWDDTEIKPGSVWMDEIRQSRLLRWELVPTESGTRLTLRHTVEDKPWLPKVAAGWHICLDVLDLLLDGKQLGRIAGPDAKAEWEPLNAEYAKRLGVDDTGWPLPQ